MKYGFIGCGNMAGAIIKGSLAAGSVGSADVFIYDVDRAMQESKASLFGVQGCESLSELVASAGIVFLAVKPDALPGLLASLRPLLKGAGKPLVSMAAGQPLQRIGAMLSVPGTPIVRIMPNLNAQVGAGMTAVCRNQHVMQPQYEELLSFFDAIGKTVEIEEKDFPVFSAIAGCSPAFTLLYIDSLAKAAQKLGMNKKKACAIAAQAVLGSARLLLDTDAHPWALIDSVCSPGGTTIEGICTLEAHHFQTAVVSAVEAAVAKDKSLAGS